MSNAPAGGDLATKTKDSSVPSRHRSYDLSYKMGSTEAFGLCNLFLSQHGVEDDKDFYTRTAQQLRTLSLKSPLLQDLRKNFDYYAVDMHAILPHTWDLIKAIPERGDDIDASKANCVITPYSLFVPIQAFLSDYPLNSVDGWVGFSDFDKFLHMLAYVNALFAPDSLFACTRRPLHKRVGLTLEPYVKELLKQGFDWFHLYLQNINTGGNKPILVVKFLDSEGNAVNFKTYDFTSLDERMRFFFDFEENPYFAVVNATNTHFANAFTAIQAQISTVAPLWKDDSYLVDHLVSGCPNAEVPINIDEIIAYQLCCFEYQTNSKIDFIYSAKMYRALFEGWLANCGSNTFTFNGVTYMYDGFSNVCLAQMLDSTLIVEGDDTDALGVWYTYNLVLSLLTKKRSLRYIDYFVGGRTTPLASGDVNVSVIDNQVSAVDTAKGLSYSRLLLAAARAGGKFEDQLHGVFGSTPRTRTDEPVHLAHLDCIVYGIETQNTGDDQMLKGNSITTNLTSRTNDFAFGMDISESTILIGIATYEITRFYLEGWTPFANKVDRFDMFNPYLQYMGDQPIKQSELYAGLSDDLTFAFAQKDIEYKLNTDFAVGDFLETLRGWIFAQQDIKDPVEQSSDFIRSHRSELDRYFLSMTGTMPWQRYHFICLYDNRIEATRNMLYNPQILF